MSSWRKCWGDFPPSTPDLLSLTSGSGKNNRPELDNRRLTLCHAKVGRGGDKSISVSPGKNVGGTYSPLGFAPMRKNNLRAVFRKVRKRFIKLEKK